MNGPILKNFQNTGDLGVKIFKTQFYCPKNLFVQNYLARTGISVRVALVKSEYFITGR